ncbi:MAG: macro domain-containing protein [Calditrichaeota bacterium]|nr:macro domain-containing protein [Calditrichota bacterium]MCB9366308.1 macro domain-containing protein [Calditrichota bacterium]
MNWGLGEIDTFVGDVWELATEAIICPIHCEMRPAGQIGVDLLRRAGHEIEKELLRTDHLPRGQVILTDAGDLDCARLIHMAVTTLAKGPTVEVLKEALRNALMMAYYNQLRSVAIPAAYIEPGELLTSAVAKTMVGVSMDHLVRARFPGRIVLVVPTDYVHNVFLQEIETVRYGEPLR